MEAKTLFWLIIIACGVLIVAKNAVINTIKKKLGTKISGGIYIKSIIAIGLMLLFYVACEDAKYKNSIENPYTNNDFTTDVYTAYETAKKEIRKQLKAPSTAVFAKMSDSEAKYKINDDGSVIIQSYVDAENSFGAKIRTYFRCKVKNDIISDLETW